MPEMMICPTACDYDNCSCSKKHEKDVIHCTDTSCAKNNNIKISCIPYEEKQMDKDKLWICDHYDRCTATHKCRGPLKKDGWNYQMFKENGLDCNHTTFNVKCIPYIEKEKTMDKHDKYLCTMADGCTENAGCDHRNPHVWLGPRGAANCGDHTRVYFCPNEHSKCLPYKEKAMAPDGELVKMENNRICENCGKRYGLHQANHCPTPNGQYDSPNTFQEDSSKTYKANPDKPISVLSVAQDGACLDELAKFAGHFLQSHEIDEVIFVDRLQDTLPANPTWESWLLNHDFLRVVEETYSAGDTVKFCSNEYLLAKYDTRQVAFFNLKDGWLYNSPLVVEDTKKIPKSIIKEWIGRDFTKIPNPHNPS